MRRFSRGGLIDRGAGAPGCLLRAPVPDGRQDMRLTNAPGHARACSPWLRAHVPHEVRQPAAFHIRKRFMHRDVLHALDVEIAKPVA
ncbi:hypothetical protein P3T16_003805 [Paraburkholderia sp. GAS42]